MNSGMVNPTMSAVPSMSVMMRRTWPLVSPPGSAPSPNTISLLSIVSTSKWMATRVQPVLASQSSNGRVFSRSSSGLNDWMPRSATFGKSSSLHECNPNQGDPVWRHGRRKQLQHVGVTVTGERSDGHCVVAGVLTLWGADVRMRVDPQDCQIVTVPTSEFGEWRHAHRALAPERRDPRRVVLADNL